MSKTALERAIERIKKAGFSHIKVEMEADLGREDADYECSDCYGEGYDDCYECEGRGIVSGTRPNNTDVEVECDECNGEGRVECNYCNGSGRASNEEHYDEDYCHNFLLENVSEEARKHLTYGKFYYDGSVDSEFTFTIPIEHSADLPQWIEAFNKLGNDEIGNGVDTGGAGLHVSVIPEYSKGDYPIHSNNYQFPSRNIENFKTEVQKLLPALFFLASANKVSRSFEYRAPRISDSDKYSAIFTHSDTTLEYRLFETCYNEPEKIFEYIEVIANTLEFYTDPTKKVEMLGKQFDFGGRGTGVNRFYNTPEKINILRYQLKYLRPEGVKLAQLFKERGVHTITELRKTHSKQTSELRKKYKDIVERNKTLKETPLSDYQEERKRELINNYDYTEQQADDDVRNIRDIGTLRQYIDQELFGNGYGDYRVSC